MTILRVLRSRLQAAIGSPTCTLVILNDFAQNHGDASFRFIEERGKNEISIFVADHVLAQGEDEVLRLLLTEAGRLWTWYSQDGTPLGRLPTGFECNMSIATDILCAAHRRRRD